MNESDYLYGTEEMMPMVEALDVPGNFFLRLVFGDVMEFETENVHFDRLQADRRMAGATRGQARVPGWARSAPAQRNGMQNGSTTARD